MTTATQISIPSILTANTFYWKPGSAANQRRQNEENRQAEVADFLTSLGMQVSWSGDIVTGEGHGLTVIFSYSESCNNVYKHLTVRRGNKNSNITSLRKLVDKLNA